MKEDLLRRLMSFRSQMERARDANRGKEDKYAQGIVMITSSLLAQFDRMFDPSIIKGQEDYHSLIDKYCYPAPGCPICNSEMSMITGKFGPFFGCKRHPDCNGIRRAEDKRPSMNEALKLFLTQKVYEDTIEVSSAEDRFKNLDI